MNDKIRDRDRDRPPRDDPYDNLKNIHLDVHGIRRQILGAIGSVEQSQTRLVSTFTAYLKRIEEKIDGLAPAPGGGITPEDEAAAKRIRASAQSASERLTALAARQ